LFSAGVVVPLVLMAVFAGLSLFGLAMIKDFHGLRSNYEARYPEGSPYRQRARRASLFPAWFFLITGTVAVVGIPVSIIAHAH
jgi:hypothetical protein